MRKRRKAVGTGVLVALGGLASLSVPAIAGTAVTPVKAATVYIHPAVQRVGHVANQPLTTAQCEADFQVACYEPAQIQDAYNLRPLYNKGIAGAGTTIVIVDSFGSPTIQADLSVFDRQFGLPAPPSLRVIQPAGAVPPYDPTNSDMVGWAGETTLDVEYAHTIAPAANILLVETPVSETEGVTGFPQIVTAEKYVIDHHLGDVISQSFSATEQTFTGPAQLAPLRAAYIDAFQHGVTVLAASGDSGAANTELDGETYYLYPTTEWPPSDPLVTGIGGTQLHLNASGRHVAPDSVWNDTYSPATNEFIFGDAGPNPLASGGGKSIFFARPYYQDGVQNVVGRVRGVPDISMSGACNGAVDTYQSFGGQTPGWYPVCGTSEATPLFAGIVALADQVAGHPLGLINPALYAMSEGQLPGIVPVTSGNNTVSFTQDNQLDTVNGFSGRPVYSLATGVGTVNGALFVPELANLAG
ncbi:MAG TPA: S53 family peptidase [Trebonia sp.]|nr:S53 family peptidase [Trebonia sp.]